MPTVGQQLADLEYALHAARETGNANLLKIANAALRDEYAKYPALKGYRVGVPFPQYDFTDR